MEATAPHLRVGWWNDLDDADANQVRRDHYGKALAAIRGLKAIDGKGSQATIRPFRDFWRSLPQLEDSSGLDQMSRTCDALLSD